MSRAYPTSPRVAVGVVVLCQDTVLLVRRAQPPSMGRWSIPGGVQEVGETVEAAARRELREETALELGTLRFLAYVDRIEHDLDGRVLYHYTILDFVTRVQAATPVAGDDASEARFFDFAGLAALGLEPTVLAMLLAARQAEP